MLYYKLYGLYKPKNTKEKVRKNNPGCKTLIGVLMEMLLVIGGISAINLIILKLKVDHHMYANAFIDLIVYIAFIAFSGATLGGLVIATSGSLLVSLFLFVSPPNLGGVK